MTKFGYKQLKERTQWNPYLLGTTTPMTRRGLVADHVWPQQILLCMEFFPMFLGNPLHSRIHSSHPDKPEVQLLERHLRFTVCAWYTQCMIHSQDKSVCGPPSNLLILVSKAISSPCNCTDRNGWTQNRDHIVAYIWRVLLECLSLTCSQTAMLWVEHLG